MNALVLGGGGGKGSYEIGVWKALREFGVEDRFSCVLGTSVGALNAALFAQSDLEYADALWRALSTNKLLPHNAGGKGAIANQEALKQILLYSLRPLPTDISVYVCCSRIVEGNPSNTFFGADIFETYEPEYIRLNTLPKIEQIQYLLASAALPFAFDWVTINGIRYRDGGIIPEHNLPYQKAVALGYDRVLAVSLEPGVTREFTWKNARIMVLHPSRPLGDMLDGTMDFEGKNAELRLVMGFQDTLEKSEQILALFGGGPQNRCLLGKDLERWLKSCFQKRLYNKTAGEPEYG